MNDDLGLGQNKIAGGWFPLTGVPICCPGF
jgi:hypothetical protein